MNHQTEESNATRGHLNQHTFGSISKMWCTRRNFIPSVLARTSYCCASYVYYYGDHGTITSSSWLAAMRYAACRIGAHSVPHPLVGRLTNSAYTFVYVRQISVYFPSMVVCRNSWPAWRCVASYGADPLVEN